MLDQKVLTELQEYVECRLERTMRYACYLLAGIAEKCEPLGELED